MRKLKLLFMLCLVAMAASASKTVYLIPGPWNADGARYALYMFSDTENSWVSFTEGTDGIWSAEFDEVYSKMIICRMNGESTENSWDNKWNQSADLAAPFADGLTYTITATGDSPSYYISAYLYNPTTGLFLSRGACYGTAAWADNFGIPVIFIENDGGYRLQMMDQSDQYVSDASWSYVDGGTDRAQTYTVSAVTDGYKFVNKAHSDGRTLYINTGAQQEGFSYQIASNGASDNCTEGWDVWQLKTSTQRQAILANRITEAEAAIATAHSYTLTGTLKELVEDVNTFAATDKTSSITNAALTGDYSTGWTYTKINNGGNATTNNSDGIEVYQGCGTFSQTVSGLANGIYKVTLGGFYRDGWNARCSELSNNGWKLGNAYLEANGNKVMLVDWASDRSANDAPNGTGAAKTLINDGKYLNEVFANVTDGKLTINIAQPGGATAGRWLFFSNATLTYYSDHVSDEDAAAIIAQAEALEATPMLAATKAALTSAKTTFSGAKTIANYNALGTVIAAAQASADVYAPLGAAIADANTKKTTCVANGATYTTTFETNIAAINTAYTEGSIAETDITAKVNEVKAEVVLLVKSQTAEGSDMTLVVPNAACNAAAGEDNWKIEAALATNEFFRLDTWAGTASGMSVPMIEYWISNGNTLSSNVIYQTISGLQPGVYTVTAETAVNNESNVAPNAGSALLFANEATTDITTGGTQTNFKGQTGTFTVQVVLTDADNGELKMGLKTVSPNYNWIAFKNVKLTFDGAIATDEQKQALAEAITAAEANTLGFEAGEYAPYNNVAAVEALAAAKAIVPATAASTEVVAATTALTAATWTANTEEVNAFYDGDFSEPAIQETSADGTKLPGWTSGNNIRQILGTVKTFPGLADASANKAIFAWSGGATYGQENGYTMPLKANTSYVLKFKAAGWNNETRSGMTVSVLNGEDGLAATDLGAPDRDIKGNENNTAGMTSFEKVFTTGAAGNYIFSIRSGNNIVMTDFDLRVLNPVYAVVGSNQEETDKAIFSGIWDAATTTDLLVENEGVWTKTYTDQELDAQTIVYKVIMKTSEESTKAAEWYPSGDNLTISIPVKGKYDITFTFTEGETPTVTGVATKTAEAVTIGEKGWATTVTNSPLNFAGQTVVAYTATVADNNTVSLTKVDNVQAETGLVLKGTPGTYYIPVVESSSTEKGSLMFSSIYDYKMTDDEYAKYTFYGLTVNGQNEAQFVKLNQGTIDPQKAFLMVEGAAGARELKVVFADDTTTGINGVATVNGAERIYNINGQRVAAPAKGLYIVNGKKVVLK